MDVLDEHRLLLDNVNSRLDISYKKAAEVTPEDLVDVEVIVGKKMLLFIFPS